MPTDESEFIDAGLTHYADALRTMEHFRARVTERAKEAVRSRTAWDGFQPDRKTLAAAWSGVASSEPWMAVRIEGVLPHGERAQLEVGVWWISPDAPIAYSGFRQCEWAAKNLTPPEHSGIRVEGKQNRHFACEAKGAELEHSWTRTLDALLESVRAVAIRDVDG